jgi:hypothetical protein
MSDFAFVIVRTARETIQCVYAESFSDYRMSEDVKEECAAKIAVLSEFMPKQMMLMNVDDIAMAIAEQLNSLNVDCDANINLQINNESGNEWIITRT